MRVDWAEFDSPSSGASERSLPNPPASRTLGLSNFSSLLISWAAVNGEGKMTKRKRYGAEQVIGMLREAEVELAKGKTV